MKKNYFLTDAYLDENKEQLNKQIEGLNFPEVLKWFGHFMAEQGYLVLPEWLEGLSSTDDIQNRNRELMIDELDGKNYKKEYPDIIVDIDGVEWETLKNCIATNQETGKMSRLAEAEKHFFGMFTTLIGWDYVQGIEYDKDGMIEMLNQLYCDMKDDIESYAQEYWYECLNEMDEDDMPEDLEEEFTEWWDNEDTSMIEEDLCQMASELLSEIEGKEVECDDLDEYFQVLDKLGEEVGFAYDFGYLRNILDYGVDLYNDCEIILEN